MNHGGMGPECGTPAGIAHAFLPAPFYPERCDARVEDDGKRRQCGQPRNEHQL